MSKGLFALLLAGTFMVPHINPSFGSDSTVGLRVQGSASEAQSWSASPSVAIPYLEATPWLTSDSALDSPKADILGNRIETLGPFVLAPSIPAKQSLSTQ